MKKSRFSDSQILSILNNRTVRYDWLAQYLFESTKEVQNYATCWLWHYNNELPNMGPGGIPPQQKLAAVA